MVFPFVPVFGSKGGILGQKTVFGGCFVKLADLKQRQRTTAMDHRNKTQSLVLPTGPPGDVLDCITEHDPCACECGHVCLTAPTAQKLAFSIKPCCI